MNKEGVNINLMGVWSEHTYPLHPLQPAYNLAASHSSSLSLFVVRESNRYDSLRSATSFSPYLLEALAEQKFA